MRDVDVILQYEVAVRELDVACAVKCIGERHFGLQVELVQWPYEIAQATRRFRPRVVILPHFYHEEERNLHADSLLGWFRAVYLNLAWEQLLYRGGRERKLPRGELATKHVVHHAWSDAFAKLLRQQGVPGEHIFLNGNLAFALYEEPYRRYYLQRADLARRHQLDPSKPWIFFPENYNWAFYSDEQIGWFAGDHDEGKAMARFCRLSLDEVLMWCGALSERGNVELIIRPRPSTPLSEFEAAVERILPAIPGGMHLVKEETVREWILASDVVISSHSTSLIEAAVAGKRAYMLEPHPIPESLHMGWHDCTPRLRTQAEFEDACLAQAEQRAEAELGAWARSTMMARGDAIWNLVDYMAQVSHGEAPHPPYHTRSSLPRRFGLPAWLSVEGRKLYRAWKRLRKHPDAPVRPEHEKDFVGKNEIRRRTERWAEILDPPGPAYRPGRG
jgi:hypothetical protein